MRSKHSLLPAGLVFLMGILFLCGCSPFYVVRAAYEQTKILLAREDIPEIIADPTTSAEEREKLSLVLEAREFGVQMGLDPKEAFTMYSRVDGDAVAWVVSAAPRDKFELYQWWFPIVGSIPYKGFFDKQDALDEAADLQTKGFETWVRGTEAFSTLGWFNDPVLSTTLRNHPVRIANTVLHESLHSTVWIPNHVDFNESLANFFGFQASLEFFKQRAQRCDSKTDPLTREHCSSQSASWIEKASHDLTRELDISRSLEAAYAALATLYRSDLPIEDKLERRQQIFSAEIAPLRERYPDLRILSEINNAEILQLRLYLAHLDEFARLFRQSSGDWSAFLAHAREVKRQVEENSAAPFSVLESLRPEGSVVSSEVIQSVAAKAEE